MSMLERAIDIAVKAHAGQLDKAGEPYILHPLRVMLSCTSEDARIVGVLHDVVEDTEWTFQQLKTQGFSACLLPAGRSAPLGTGGEACGHTGQHGPHAPWPGAHAKGRRAAPAVPIGMGDRTMMGPDRGAPRG